MSLTPYSVPCMLRRDLRLLLALCVLAAGWAIAQSQADLTTGFLFLAPTVIMAVPLIAGRYVGAERLSQITRSVSPRRRGTPAGRPVRRPFRLVPPRGGLLIAASLAVRPPPPVLSAY